jgi:hypothetical protein
MKRDVLGHLNVAIEHLAHLVGKEEVVSVVIEYMVCNVIARKKNTMKPFSKRRTPNQNRTVTFIPAV